LHQTWRFTFAKSVEIATNLQRNFTGLIAGRACDSFSLLHDSFNRSTCEGSHFAQSKQKYIDRMRGLWQCSRIDPVWPPTRLRHVQDQPQTRSRQVSFMSFSKLWVLQHSIMCESTVSHEGRYAVNDFTFHGKCPQGQRRWPNHLLQQVARFVERNCWELNTFLELHFVNRIAARV